MCALAERAWSKEPDWAAIDDLGQRKNAFDTDWNEFANRLGQIELPRLDNLFGGVRYRIPLPGAKIEDGLLKANTSLPGLTIRYTTDGREPTETSPVFEQPIKVNSHLVKLKIFSGNGRRSSRTTIVKR
jgi:hexosaminidase